MWTLESALSIKPWPDYHERTVAILGFASNKVKRDYVAIHSAF
jgi:hypothetical protein